MSSQKRALVLSGGGRNGAFQVGACEKLIVQKKRDYASFHGTSVGSINATRLAMAKPGHNALIIAVADLRALWLERIKGNRSIYKKRFLYGAPFGRSWFSTKPLRKMVASLLDLKALRSSGRELRVGAVSYHTGDYREWTGASPHMLQAIMASSAFPMAFPMEHIDGELWMDAGVRHPAPLLSALALGATHIDVVLTTPEDLPAIEVKKKRNGNVRHPSWLHYGIRTLGIMGHEIWHDDLVACSKNNVVVTVYRPAKALGDPLNFAPAEIRRLYEAGLDALPRKLNHPTRT